MRMANRKVNGFTLIELLVTMAIMVGVVFAAGGAIALLSRTMGTTNQLTNDNSAARLAMMRLTREVRSATSVEVKVRGESGDDDSGDGATAVESQNLYLYFADTNSTGIWVLYYRIPSGELARVQGTYKSMGVDGKPVRENDGVSADTGLKIRRFSTRVDYEDDRGWLYIRIRADQNIGDETSKLDQNLMLDTKIALNRLIT